VISKATSTSAVRIAQCTISTCWCMPWNVLCQCAGACDEMHRLNMLVCFVCLLFISEVVV